MTATILHGDCVEQMRLMDDASVDSIVTDPPAGIAFMGKEWDKDKGGRDAWITWMQGVALEAIRVAKPGAHALVWALPRTSHWTVTGWEDAGWEVRDRVSHMFGTGFPKSHNLHGDWEGWGTALKPAMEDWWLLRKPLAEKTVAQNVLKYGCGALNIDACRVGTDTRSFLSKGIRSGTGNYVGDGWDGDNGVKTVEGRWPANVITDGSDEVLDAFAQYSGKGENVARFMYSAKASKADRADSKHPTVKPISLMRYLCKLVTPPGGTVLDMFAGTGTTGAACQREGFHCVLIERDAEHVETIRRRLGETFQLEAAD